MCFSCASSILCSVALRVRKVSFLSSDLVLIWCLLAVSYRNRGGLLFAESGASLKIRNPAVRTQLASQLIFFAWSLIPLDLESPPQCFCVHVQTRRWMDTLLQSWSYSECTLFSRTKHLPSLPNMTIPPYDSIFHT
jgi:hypothetical protein